MYNYLSYNSNIIVNNDCIYDSNIGYQADFSVNGDVDDWEYYDGLHTYGCWSNFLFGTLYGDYAAIGRYDTIIPFDGEVYYLVELTALIGLIERSDGQPLPSRGMIKWTTLSNPDWSDDKNLMGFLISLGRQ